MANHVTLVGAGLAGSLLSIYLARRGFAVEVYERRPDMRRVRLDAGRSINLALSTRGIHALKDVGLVEQVMRVAIPMRGRMIHPRSGPLSLQRYGRDDTEVIYATSRSQLNMALMNAAETDPGVCLHFQRRCVGIDLAAGDLLLRNEESGQELALHCPTVIGTDGSASAIRLEMQKTGRFNLSQQHLDYGYKELEIPAGPNGQFLLEKHALHIWPRGTYMLIALPNIDGSFTCTFFFPFEGPLSFATLDNEEKVRAFFQEQFPVATALMPTLTQDYFGHPTGSMVTIKCSPWHYRDRAALLGDAAHAIVPFFGQGMNCAFEDCTVLDEIIAGRQDDKTRTGELDWEDVYQRYELLRKENTDAIADLAVENFVEMRDSVAQPKFQLKKKVEQALQDRFPDRFIPKYSMVTFHRLPYSMAASRGKMQDRLLHELCGHIDRVEDLDWPKAERWIREYLSPVPLSTNPQSKSAPAR